MATKTSTIRPLGDRIVVRALEQEEKSRGGIILPDAAKEKPTRGEVLAVGSGRTTDDGKKIPLDVKVGDTILYGKYSGTEIKIEGEDFIILQERDILGVFDK
jgi:chaperonin GroES